MAVLSVMVLQVNGFIVSNMANKKKFSEMSLEERVLQMLAGAAARANREGAPHADAYTSTYFEYRNSLVK